MKFDDLFAELEAAQQARRLPPVHLWQPDNVGSIDIVIRADGTWWHEGAPFQRESLVRLFTTLLRREGERYFLVTPVEKLEILVEDAPLVALDFEFRGAADQAELIFTTNGGDHVVADAEHPVWIEADRPYIHVRDGLNALIQRSAFYRLADLAEEGTNGWFLTSRGARFPLYMLG